MKRKNYYSEEVMKRFLDPEHFGEMEDPSGVGKVGNPRCGDEMTVYIKVEDEKIKDASFETWGCAAAISTSDAVCEMVKGKTLDEALSLTEKEMVEKLKELPAPKVHCASLAIQGLKKAVEDHYEREE